MADTKKIIICHNDICLSILLDNYFLTTRYKYRDNTKHYIVIVYIVYFVIYLLTIRIENTTQTCSTQRRQLLSYSLRFYVVYLRFRYRWTNVRWIMKTFGRLVIIVPQVTTAIRYNPTTTNTAFK